MTRSVRSQGGMSLVEATIILFVLMLLTSVLAPSMGDFIIDAKMVKVKEDCESIGIAVMRLVRDVGPCLKTEANGSCLDVIYSLGSKGNHDWPDWGGDMDEQFVTNSHAGQAIYALRLWRGAYLSGPIGPDPWGTRYAVNTKFLIPPAAEESGASPRFISASTCRSRGGLTAGTGSMTDCDKLTDQDRDVICLSAGPNRLYETYFAGTDTGGTWRRGDDFVYVLQGSQRSYLWD